MFCLYCYGCWCLWECEVCCLVCGVFGVHCGYCSRWLEFKLNILRNRKKLIFFSWYHAVYRKGYQNFCDGQVINLVLPVILAGVGYTAYVRFVNWFIGDAFMFISGCKVLVCFCFILDHNVHEFICDFVLISGCI